MTHHDDEHDDDRDVDKPRPGPTADADDATQADAGLTGTPARSYSPKGMADDDGSDERRDD